MKTRATIMGVAIVIVACLASLPNTACDPFVQGAEECWEGVVEGDIVEIELVERYLEGGPYRWGGISRPTPTSCEGVDGLHTGDRVRFRVERGLSLDVSPCVSHRGIPIDTVTNVTFAGARGEGEGAVLGTQAQADGICRNSFWQFYARRSYRDQDHNPFDELPVLGEYPPLMINRWIDGCGCQDDWVGVIRHVVPDDAGVDAR